MNCKIKNGKAGHQCENIKHSNDSWICTRIKGHKGKHHGHSNATAWNVTFTARKLSQRSFSATDILNTTTAKRL